MGGLYEFTGSGIVGVVNYDRLKTATRYQKLLAKLSKRYKRRFMDYTPIEVEHKGGGNYDVFLDVQAGKVIEVATKPLECGGIEITIL